MREVAERKDEEYHKDAYDSATSHKGHPDSRGGLRCVRNCSTLDHHARYLKKLDGKQTSFGLANN